MKRKLFFLSLFTLCFYALPVQACPDKPSKPLAYSRRDKNRCEGLVSEKISSGLQFVSFAIKGTNPFPYPNLFSLQVPRFNSPFSVRLQSFEDNYLLDKIDSSSFVTNNSLLTFTWKSDILNKAKLLPRNLRALATVTNTSQRVYLPVIIGKSSNRYEFVFKTPHKNYQVMIPSFQILRDGSPVYSAGNNQLQSGEITFNWDGRNQPSGRYQLRIVTRQSPYSAKNQKEAIFSFQHYQELLQ
jgi:hypothetical protein